MNVTEPQRLRLVEALAQRFPGFEARQALASAAGLADVQLAGETRSAWRVLVGDALERGRLAALLDAAAKARPEDAALGKSAAAAKTGRLVVPGEAAQRLIALAAVLGIAVVMGGMGIAFGYGLGGGFAESTPSIESKVSPPE